MDSAQFIYDLAKFEHSAFADDPARRSQSAARESFTASGCVADGDGVGARIEANFVRSGVSAGAIRA
jgi:hypothetical protein